MVGCHTIAANEKGSGSMQIISATYGASCGAPKGNATDHLAKACDGTAKCEYRIDHQVLGDPRRGCAKNFEAEYRCSHFGGSRTASAPAEASGTVTTLTCPSFLGIF